MNLQLTNNLEWSEASVNGESVLFPVEWSVQRFHDLGSFKTGKDHKAVAGVDYPVYGSSSTPMSMRAVSSIYAKDSFIIGRKGTIDKPFFVKGPFWCVDTAMYFENDTAKADIRFLYYKAKAIPWLKYNSGSTIPSLTQSLANSLAVALPELKEQTAIANILSDQETLVAHHNDLIALHEKRFAYLSDELLSGRLRLKVENNVYTFVVNELWANTEFNGEITPIPKDWSISNFGEQFTVSGGGTPSSTNALFWNGDIPWVGPVDMGDSNLYIESGGRFLSQKGAAKLGSKKVAKNSVVLSTRAPVGYVKIAANDLYTNQGCQSLYSEKFNAVYVAQWLRLHQWILDKNSSGSTFKELSSKNLKKIQLAYPPIEEQILIANVLSDQEALIAEYKKLRDAEKKRFDWLSDALLSGTYRVKIEP